MLRFHKLLLGSFLFVFIFFAQAQSPYRQGVLHVKFKKESYKQLKISSNARQSGITDVDHAFESIQVTSIKRVFREGGIFEKAHQAFGLHLWYEVQFNDTLSTTKAVRQVEEANHFDVVEPARAYSMIKPVAQTSVRLKQNEQTGVPSDPLFADQWHYQNTGQTGGTPGADISLVQAWTQESGSPSVVVAVIDGGIDYQHPDLFQSMWINADEIAGNGVDDDSNGYIDDIYGFGFGDNTGIIYPDFHGTHVGGTIGAVTNNSIGVSGIAGGTGTGNGVRLMSLAGFGNSGVGGFEDAMVYAADNGAVISQNSWGGGGTAIEAAIDYFVARAGLDNSDAKFNDNIQIGPMRGGIVIFAAGNSNTDNPFAGYPASYPPVVAVASTDHNDQKSYFSNFGSWVDISAPGSEVLSTYPVGLGSYALLSGTSMACPHVSGVAALVISKFGGSGFVPEMVWERLLVSADNIDSKNPAFISKLGSGRLNANHALEVNDGIPPASISDLRIVEPRVTSIRMAWTATGSSGMVGSASSYDLRYSTSPITASNFDNAQPFSLSGRPLPAGSTEDVQITGLAHNTTYYVAVKARDFFGNYSGISNVVVTTTLPPPVIEVTPAAVTENLFAGDTSIQYITIRNAGVSALEFEIGHREVSQSGGSSHRGMGIQFLREQNTRVPLPTEDRYKKTMPSQPVNQIAHAPSHVQTEHPLSGGRLFMLNSSSGSINEINPLSGSVVQSVPLPESLSSGPDGLAFDGKFLYYLNGFGTNILYRINPDNGAVVSSMNLLGLGNFDALGHSGKYVYALDYGLSRILEIDFDAGTVERIITPGISMIGGLTFGGSRGTVFVTNSPNTVYELNLETGAVVNSFNLGVIVYGLGYSESLNVLFAADVSNGLVRAFNPDNGELLYVLSVGFTSALATDEGRTSGWFTVESSLTTLMPGQSTQVPILFDARELLGGTYQGLITINSNDPVTPVVEVPVTLQVTGASNIVVKPLEVDFGLAYEGGVKTKSIVIGNTGTDVLLVESMSIDNPSFMVDFESTSISSGDSAVFSVAFQAGSIGSYSASLSIKSNDPNQQTVTVSLLGQVVLSPIIELSPDSIGVTLNSGQEATRTIDILNSGEGNLVWNISVEGQEESELSAVLPNLNAHHSSITSLIPNRYNFYEGESGFYISDGGGDMYDGGNYLATNLGGYLMYTNGQITASEYLGVGGKYFTAKYEGLFVLAADVAITEFIISGNAGADGSGNVDGAVLTTTVNGKSFKGFVKRIYNAWDPSINQLIIVEDNGSVTHTFPLNTDDDRHTLSNLGNVRRLYYLLYAGANGHFIDNASTLAIMREFLSSVNHGVNWMTPNPTNGTTPSGSSTQAEVTFSAVGMNGGEYHGKLIVQSNDPVDEIKSIPVSLTVIGVPNIHLPLTSINFGSNYLGAPRVQEFEIVNAGTDRLSVTSITTSNTNFIVSSLPFELSPGHRKSVIVEFNPATIGSFSGELIIHSNDPDQPAAPVSVTGTVISAAVLTVLPAPVSASVLVNQRKAYTLTLSNTGGEELNWYLGYNSGPLSILPYNGRINPGEQQSAQLYIDAWNLPVGDYVFEMYLYYNHPVNPYFAIRVNVTVYNNHAPELIKDFSTHYLSDETKEVSVNLAAHISDQDGDALQFTVSTSTEGVVSMQLLGTVLTLEAQHMGSTQVTVVAEDFLSARLQSVFDVVVGTITETEEEMTGDIQFYPNPFDHHNSLQLRSTKESTVKIDIFDTQGKLVYQLDEVTLLPGVQTVQDIGTSFQAGLYYARIYIDKERVKTIKLIKK